MRNLIERAIWTGIQTGLAIVTVDGLTAADADPRATLTAAVVAAVLSAVKTMAVGRLNTLKP